ncbi:hypothetical protein GCM10010505_70020 [Kitasatospora aburaviensis]
MEAALRDWIYTNVTEQVAVRVLSKLRISPHGGQGEARRNQLAHSLFRKELLDVVDCALSLNLAADARAAYERLELKTRYPEPFVDPVARLSEVLGEAGSAYQVRSTEDGLERVVDATVTEAARKAGETADATGRSVAKARLRAAWLKAYALHPDPGAAYADALRAVEDVACPLFLPSNSRPTLGNVRSHLEQAAHKYELVIQDENAVPASVDTVTAMIALLWHGHRDRHEGGPSSAPISEEAAKAAVHLAATLVQWLSAGVVQRKTP